MKWPPPCLRPAAPPQLIRRVVRRTRTVIAMDPQKDREDDPLAVVWEDVGSAEKALAAENSPYNRRSYVRTVFAAIEGITAFLRVESLRSIRTGALRASHDEIAMLHEEGYSLTDSGEITSHRRFVPLDASVRFLFRLYFDRRRPGTSVDYSEPGWAAFKRALKVRHRITHPRHASDLVVSDAEIVDSRDGHRWVTTTMLRTFADLLERRDAPEGKAQSGDAQRPRSSDLGA